jgi:predicted porin
MKKVLYGSTALVSAAVVAAAPAQAAEKIKLGLGGYYNSFFAVGDVNGAGTTEYLNSNVYSEGEVHFKGSTALDNGLEIGFQAQLEINISFGDIIDEAYVYVDGGFGRFLIGSENSAAYTMQVAAPSVGTPINSGWVTAFIPPAPGSTGSFRAPSVSTYGDFGNDDNKLTYFTPRISGFQLGVSYAPDVAGAGGQNNGLAVDGASTGEDGISLGVNYSNKFGSTSFTVAGGYRTQSLTAAGADDWAQYSAGISVGFGGFTVGGSYLKEDSDLATDGSAFDLGVSYATGPWKFGLHGIFTEVEGNLVDTTEDEMMAIKGAAAYALAPGVEASFTVMYADWEVETSEGPNGDVDGIMGIVGIKLGF